MRVSTLSKAIVSRESEKLTPKASARLAESSLPVPFTHDTGLWHWGQLLAWTALETKALCKRRAARAECLADTVETKGSL